jgi:CheY-like chemotaxis protein
MLPTAVHPLTPYSADGRRRANRGANIQMSIPFILYVEDDMNDVFFLRNALQANSIPARLVHIRNPQEFSAALTHIEPDLILADGNVPGFDTSAALKLARDRCPIVPFYYLSGTVSEEKAGALVAAGATGCLSKNDPTAVSTAIREALRHQHRNW